MGYLESFLRQSVWFSFLTLCTLGVSAGIELSLARLLQYSKDDQSYGSQLAALSFYASHFQGDVLRKVAFLHANEVTEERVTEVLYKKPNGLIIILPGTIHDAREWLSLQHFFYTNSFPIPIYFAFEDKPIMELYELLKEADQEAKEGADISLPSKIMDKIMAEDYQVSVSINEPTIVRPLKLENYYYLLSSSFEETKEDKPLLPIIMVTATYDSFSLSPELSFGVNTNGSGMIALLELIKIFQKLFEVYGNYAKYDLMFLLTPTGALNYKGTDAFLNDLPEAYSQNIVFALCLDSIGVGDNLNLHISRQPKEAEETSNSLFKALNQTTQQMNIQYKTVQKAINQSSEFVPWEHERFAYKRVHAATLSSRNNASVDLLEKVSIYDNTIDEEILKRNIEVAAEALTKVMFDLLGDNHLIFTGDYKAFESGYVRQLLNYLKANSRFPTKLTRESDTMKELHKIFTKIMPNMTTHVFEYKDQEFATNSPAKMKVTKSKSRLLDMFLFVVIAIYLFGLYIYMTGLAKVMETFRAKKVN